MHDMLSIFLNLLRVVLGPVGLAAGTAGTLACVAGFPSLGQEHVGGRPRSGTSWMGWVCRRTWVGHAVLGAGEGVRWSMFLLAPQVSCYLGWVVERGEARALALLFWGESPKDPCPLLAHILRLVNKSSLPLPQVLFKRLLLCYFSVGLFAMRAL